MDLEKDEGSESNTHKEAEINSGLKAEDDRLYLLLA